MSSNKYIPIYVISGVFGAIFAFGPLFVRKGPNRAIIRVSIMLSAFCIWIFWVTAYISQMNPLAGPRLHNTTLAWYQYAFGTKVADGSGSDDNDANPAPDPGVAGSGGEGSGGKGSGGEGSGGKGSGGEDLRGDGPGGDGPGGDGYDGDRKRRQVGK